MTSVESHPEKTALVLGSSGQDGSFLTEILASQGHTVHGISRHAKWRQDIDAPSGYTHHQLDLCDIDALAEKIETVSPDLLFHVAAAHGSSGFSLEERYVEAFLVNTISLNTCLEYMRRAQPGRQPRLFYTSSVRIFGAANIAVRCEKTPVQANEIYSINKIASQSLIDAYNREHNVVATYGIMANHDSARRSDDYFVPKIAAALRGAIENQKVCTTINTLDFFIDIGHAREYMEIAIDHMQLETPSPLLYATGKPIYGAQLVAETFDAFDLDWRKFIIPKSRDYHSSFEDLTPPFRFDNSRLVSSIGSPPQYAAKEVVLDVLKQRYGISQD